MKKLKLLILLFFCLFQLNSQSNLVFAQYSNAAIQGYNAAVLLQRQGKYELAEQKYQQVLKIQPDCTEAKKNLKTLYQNLAYECHSKENYEKAVFYSKKALNYDSKDIYAYQVLAQSYLALNDKQNAILTYQKMLALESNDDATLHSLAQVYIQDQQFSEASRIYKQLLSINPNDNIARQNLKYITYSCTEKTLNESLNNVHTEQSAPNSVYRLIKPSAGITIATVDKMKTILDLVWSEPSGRILLQGLVNKRIPINITQGALNANSTTTNKTNTFYLYGLIPVFSFDTSSICVNVPFNYISNFNNPNLTSRERIYSLHVFIHEFGHAFISSKEPNHKNSIEEELGVSMIGLNISHKVITGQYLTREQTEMYSMGCLESLFSDDHKKLPFYNGFDSKIQQFGIVLPYPETYSNINAMYNQLVAEGKIIPIR